MKRLLVVLGACLAAAVAYAQQPARSTKAGIAGTVRDSLGHPIASVNVIVDGGHATTISDDSGRFDLRGLPSGDNGLTLLKVGFSSVSFTASLPADSVVVVAVTMRHVQVLSTVNVSAERMNASLTRLGFFDRQRVGLGTFLTPAHIDSLADKVMSASQLLRDVRGIELRCGAITCVPVSRGRAACLMLFVDGAPYGSADWMDSVGFSPNAIAAMEVYDRASQVPIEFQAPAPVKQGRGMSAISGCGAIVMWTKMHVR